MINKYNIYKALLISSAPLTVFSLFAIYVLNSTETLIILSIFQSARAVLMYIWIFTICSILSLYLGEVLYKRFTHDTVKNIFKSYSATYRLRRFAHTYSTQKDFITPNGIVEMNAIKKANLSVLTLVVTFKDDSATMRIKLPADHKGQEIIKSLFPSMKAQLNAVDSTFLFNDIIPKNGRICHSTGKIILNKR